MKKYKKNILLPFLLFLAAAACLLFPKVLNRDADLFSSQYRASDRLPITSLPEEPDPAKLPVYSGNPTIEINGNNPFFKEEDLKADDFQYYSKLDFRGRCGSAAAMLGTEMMPTEERGEIGMVKPSGWQKSEYDCVDGGSLYNRCHLLGYQLTGQNANERNLITGTRYMNVDGMQPYENRIAAYLKETGGHVLLRVTPVFEGKNLVASGVLMEAASAETTEQGQDADHTQLIEENHKLSFCVYCYNVQPGIKIDYRDGSSEEEPSTLKIDPDAESVIYPGKQETAVVPEGTAYVLNTNTMKFHLPDCESVPTISDHNRIYSKDTRDKLIAEGYSPCGICGP